MSISEKSFAQYSQDLRVLDFYDQTRNGFFVDIGAFDGVSISNTYKLELELDWSGICVEAQEDIYQRLRSARSCICVNAAVSSVDGETVVFSKGRGGNSVLSGITQLLDSSGRKAAMRGEQLKMVTTTITSILSEYKAPAFIHYMSLDTEGSELEVLQGTDLGNFRFGYICVEHNFSEPRRSKMRELLEKSGYVFFQENYCDDDYYHRSLIGGTYYFNDDAARPILVELMDDNMVKASSAYWPDQYGVFRPNRLQIDFDQLGTRRISALSISKSNRDRWYKRPGDLVDIP